MYNFSKTQAVDAWKKKNSPGSKIESKDFSQRIIYDGDHKKVILTHIPTGNSWMYDLPKEIENLEDLINNIIKKEEVIPEEYYNSRYNYINPSIRNL